MYRFRTEALTLNEFLLVAGASSLVFFAVELEKKVFRRRRTQLSTWG